MFESLTEKLELTFKRLRGQGKITEKNIEESLREVRFALLEADVNFKVVKSFVESVKAEALGQEVLLSLTPDQQLIKIVQRELVAALGGERAELNLKGAPPQVVMLVGLQGSGKTTTLAKLALHLKGEMKRTPYLVPADVYRPAAAEQLKVLAEEVGVPIYPLRPDMKPLDICREALQEAKKHFCDLVLVDTAGRLHIDAELMGELQKLQTELRPHHTLLVVDAMTGQDAVNQAQRFSEALDLTGIILTKMDGDARGGAALSMREMVGKPILFAGVGEKLNALEPFAPDRLASRILGMGDVLTLIEKAEQAHEEKITERLAKQAQKGAFSLEDFQSQMQMMKKMGSVGELMDMIPGARKLTQKVDMSQAEKEISRVEAIINSMTRQERRNPNILNGSRRRRIASGSGTTVTDVNRLIKQFLQMKKLMQRMSRMGGKAAMGRLPFSFGS
ncbi:MAG TPA: signal recognition particle protein [Candidatus Binatia bacterium]